MFFHVVNIAVLILLMLFCNCIFKSKILKVPLIIYIGFQTIIIIGSIFYADNLFEVSSYIYVMITVNVLLFVLGFIFYFLINKKREVYKEECIDKIFYREPWISRIGILLIVVLAYFTVKYNYYLSQGHDSRMIIFSTGTVFSNQLEYLGFHKLIKPIAYIYFGISAYLLANRKFKNINLYIGIIILVLITLIGNGRLALFQYFIYYIIIIMLSNSYKQILKIVLSLLSISVIFCCISIYTTAVRMGMNEFDYYYMFRAVDELKNHIIAYFTGPLRALEYGLNGFMNNIDYSIGRLTLGGIDEAIGMFVNLFGMPYNLSVSLASETQTVIMIGPNQEFNAFYTANLAYYSDFGILGIIIVPFIFGLLTAWISKIYLEERNQFIFLIYLYNSYCMIMTCFRWEYQFLYSWIYIFILIIFYKQVKRRGE